MKNVKSYNQFINEDADPRYTDLKSPGMYKNDNELLELDGEKVWKKADEIGMEALKKYQNEHPEDKYGGTCVLGSTIWIHGVDFPNPVYNIQIAGLETMRQSRLSADRYIQKGKMYVEWYGIPNLVSQGCIFQEVYANAVMDYLKSLGFETKYDYGHMD